MSEAEILFEVKGAAGVITLNRPKALNAFTLNMMHALHPQLIAWADDPRVERIIVKAAGDRAFCAGGDIRALYDWGTSNDPMAVDFYNQEYKLNTFIKEYPKPYIAFMDGITMGGGVGLSVHGSHRVATEKTTFAMPETGIGLFPDVGGTYFLPRTPGHTGMWLSLTGARLKAADALYAGIATHYMPSADLDELEETLCGSGVNVNAALTIHASQPDGGSLEGLQSDISRLFNGSSVEDILSALDADDGEWATAQASTIRSKSPTSLKVAHRQMVDGAGADFRTCMTIEYRIVSRIMKRPDFYEGVRAAIIDKDNAPNWQPDTLKAVSDNDINMIFAPAEGGDIDLG
ncbi:enoyl-CoA hydratase/isomerase family protein [Pyruvatibacter sp.]|uniref:enoyl-CoA hydratase/isomerase family protein n=1 Tax=Pyruvatibacter sp. TaxID=1981328 RepID=UPI0032643662